MNDMERLFVAQALYSALGEYVSTKNPDSLRAKQDIRVRADYKRDSENGAAPASYNAFVNGVKVGTYSVRIKKAVPASVEEKPEVTDQGALYRWAAANGYTRTEVDMDRVLDHLRETGELPDGMELRHVVHDAQPEAVSGTTLRIDPQKVAEALGPQLPQAVVGLLSGGDAE